MPFAKKDTAKSFLVGPILDAPGVAVTGALTATDVLKVTKNGTVGAADAQDTMAHSHTGHYVVTTDGGDFDTLGLVEFSLNSGTNAMAPVRFDVLPAEMYNSLAAASGGNLPAKVAGATDGVFIAGTNAATVITTSLTTGAITLTTPIQANIAGVKTTALPAESVGGYDAAALGKLLDVASPVLTCASVNQSADNNTILASGTYGLEYIAGQLVDLSDGDHGLSALKTLLATTGIKVLSIANDAITAASINTGAFTADAFAADAIVAATFATGALTADAFAADALVAATFATGALTADAFAANALVAATFAASSLNGKGDWNTVVPDAAGVVASALTVIKGATWAAETDTLEAIRDKLPANLEDLSIADTTGVVKATDEDGNSLATKKTRPPGI